MAHFLDLIHMKAANNTKMQEAEEEETADNIPEEKLRDEDLVQ